MNIKLPHPFFMGSISSPIIDTDWDRFWIKGYKKQKARHVGNQNSLLIGTMIILCLLMFWRFFVSAAMIGGKIVIRTCDYSVYRIANPKKGQRRIPPFLRGITVRYNATQSTSGSNSISFVLGFIPEDRLVHELSICTLKRLLIAA